MNASSESGLWALTISWGDDVIRRGEPLQYHTRARRAQKRKGRLALSPAVSRVSLPAIWYAHARETRGSCCFSPRNIRPVVTLSLPDRGAKADRPLPGPVLLTPPADRRKFNFRFQWYFASARRGCQSLKDPRIIGLIRCSVNGSAASLHR